MRRGGRGGAGRNGDKGNLGTPGSGRSRRDLDRHQRRAVQTDDVGHHPEAGGASDEAGRPGRTAVAAPQRAGPSAMCSGPSAMGSGASAMGSGANAMCVTAAAMPGAGRVMVPARVGGHHPLQRGVRDVLGPGVVAGLSVVGPRVVAAVRPTCPPVAARERRADAEDDPAERDQQADGADPPATDHEPQGRFAGTTGRVELERLLQMWTHEWIRTPLVEASVGHSSYRQRNRSTSRISRLQCRPRRKIRTKSAIAGTKSAIAGAIAGRFGAGSGAPAPSD
jgi:hypothetical protein